MDLKKTVGQYLEACIDRLMEEKMKSGIEVEKNDFKSAIEQFIDQ